MQVDVVPNTNAVWILSQGSYSVGNTPFGYAAAEEIQKVSIASTILYESKRDWQSLRTADTEEEWRAAFAGKTFRDELQELESVIEHAINELGAEQIFLSGYSYGGALTVATMSNARYPISRVLLTAPELVRDPIKKDWPIYGMFPKPPEMLDKIKSYEGRFTILIGKEDHPFTVQNSHAIFNRVSTVDKALLSVSGLSHSLWNDPAQEMFAITNMFAFGDEFFPRKYESKL